MLSDQEYLRYGASTALDDVGEQGQLMLKHARITVIGLGGLGCAASQYLAAAGVGELVLVDDDRVQLSNLQRQVLYTTAQLNTPKATNAAASLSALNHEIAIKPRILRADAQNIDELIAGSDVVLDCTDNLVSRWLINQACYLADIAFVMGSAERWQGQVMSLHPNAQHGCYACLYPPGIEERPACQRAGVVSPLVGIIGATQALRAIRILLGQPVDWGVLHTFDGTTMQWAEYTLPVSSHCSHCQGDICKSQ